MPRVSSVSTRATNINAISRTVAHFTTGAPSHIITQSCSCDQSGRASTECFAGDYGRRYNNKEDRTGHAAQHCSILGNSAIGGRRPHWPWLLINAAGRVPTPPSALTVINLSSKYYTITGYQQCDQASVFEWSAVALSTQFSKKVLLRALKSSQRHHTLSTPTRLALCWQLLLRLDMMPSTAITFHRVQVNLPAVIRYKCISTSIANVSN